MAPETLAPPARRTKDIMVADPAFRAIPKRTAAFLIWRVEKLQLVALSRDSYGSFYNGDSYIIYSATDNSQPPGLNIKTKEIRGMPDLRIHFWLGENTTQDEAGVAAIKTVELDDVLEGAPIQHREVQGLESERFRAYFPNGIRYMEGGIASGLNAVNTEIKPRLFHVKGKRRPVFREMREISWNAMNEDDVYVLDVGKMIFVWNGKASNRYEKMQGAKLAQKLRTEHGGSEVVIVEDGHEERMPEDEKRVFAEHLDTGNKKLGAPTTDDVDDHTHERISTEKLKLYRCSDEQGAFTMSEVKGGPLLQADLDSNDSFIIDNHSHGVWVWIGKKATKTERTEAMRNAQGFINKKGYPSGTPIVRVIDGGEPVEFKGLFKGWQDKHQVGGTGMSKSYTFGRIAQTVQTHFDASSLHENRVLAANSQMVDDGTGKKTVWRAESFDLKPTDPKYYGAFYSGDCYVVLYSYLRGTAQCHILYYWIGKKSSADEQGTAALKTIEMDDKLGGEPVQVRVVQGKEPPHFMAIFGGRMVIFEGGKASGFGSSDQKDEAVKESFLLHVRGYSQFDTKAIEVPKRASSLNSNDVFVLFTKTTIYIWAGKGSTGDEREAAKRIASHSPREAITLFEGSEKQDFWEAIGGKEEYSSDKRLQEALPDRTPRLFHCSNASGRFKVEEVVDFGQDDLVSDDVMLLDTGDSIFMWIGDGANREERQKAVEIAKDYLRTDPKGRDDSTAIMRIKQGYEPPNFTGFFGAWDESLWSKTRSEAETDVHAPVNVNMQTGKHAGQSNVGGAPKFPMSTIRSWDPENLPEGIDVSNKEVYLNDDDFQKIFRIPYSEFTNLPAWKKTALKKSAGLF